MRLKFAPVALVALSVAFGALSFSSPSAAWAKGGKAKADKGGDDTISRQFKWEENVVGPNSKKLDRDKIAAMQEAARKEDAAHKNEPKVKKTERPAGVGVPSSSTLPTMDIEKPAPVAARTPKPRPAAEKAPKTRDSLDALLDSEKDTGGGAHSDGGLGKVLAVGDRSPAASSSAPAHDATAARTGAKSKHAARTR